MPVRKYLLKRSPPDHRDFLMAHPTASAVESLPPVFDLRNPPPPQPNNKHREQQHNNQLSCSVQLYFFP